MKKYDTVVIGSGISGLTAALILGRFGKKVALLEQFSHVAPLLRRFKRGDIWCDPGFHYTGGLDDDGPFTVLLRYLNIMDHIKPIHMDPQGYDFLQFDGKEEYLLPYGYDRFQTYLCNQFPKSAESVKQYIKKVCAINRATAFYNFDLEPGQFSDEVYKNQSLEEYLREIGAEDKLIRLLGSHGKVLYGSGPAEVPLPVHAYIMGSFYESSSTILNGGNALVRAFEKEIGRYDIDVFCNQTVTAIKTDDQRKIQGVYTQNNEYFECHSCISSIHPQRLISLLGQSNARPAFINRLKKAQNTSSPMVLFLDMDQYPDKIAHCNYYVFNKSKHKGRQGYLAFMAANQKAESRGRRSLAVIAPMEDNIFMDYFGPSYFDHYEDYLNLKNEWIEKIMDCAFSVFPEIKGQVRLVDAATPVTYSRYTNTIRGSMYGLKQTVHHRGLSTRSSLHGLYLAGQSIQLGAMGTMVSGFMAAAHLVDAKRLRNEIRACL